MFVITRELRHTERIDTSNKGLFVTIPTSSVSIAVTCGYS